jgi:hypothetical protein
VIVGSCWGGRSLYWSGWVCVFGLGFVMARGYGGSMVVGAARGNLGGIGMIV